MNSNVFIQMIQSLRRYYPDELEVLKIISSGDKEFAQSLLRDDPSSLNHLVGYGVLDQGTLEISVPAFRAWLSSPASA